MAKLQFRASATATDTGGGAFSVTKPAATADNDWLLAVAACTESAGQSIDLAGGAFTQLYANASGSFKLGYRLAATEGASYSFTQSGGAGNRAGAAAVLSYQGGDASQAPTIGIVTLASASLSVTGKGLRVPAGGALLVHVGFCNSATSNAVSATPPKGFKERIDLNRVDTNVQCHVTVSERYVLPGEVADAVATLSHAKDNAGVLLVIYQAPLASAARSEAAVETLIELTHYDEASAAETVKKYSGRGVTFTGGEKYEARLIEGGDVAQSAMDRIGIGGLVATTISDVVLDNSDRALDAIYARGTALGRAITIKRIDVTAPALSDLGAGAAASAATVFVGYVAAMTPMQRGGLDVMRISITDYGDRLNVPLQNDKYNGAAGLGGNAELQGLTNPLLLGRVFNFLPQNMGDVDVFGGGALPTFMLSSQSRPINDIVTVYIRGVVQALVAIPPTTGEWRKSLNPPAFQVGSFDGIVTCTAKGDDPATDIYANQHGELIGRMITGLGPLLPTGSVDATSIAEVDGVQSGEIGIYFPAGDRSTTRQAVDRVLRSGGLWLAGGRSGNLKLALARPAIAERLRLKESDIIALRAVPLPADLQPAPTSIEVKTERNWQPLTDFAGSVTAGNRRKLAGTGRTVTATPSTNLATRQKPQNIWSVDGLWFDDLDGQSWADQIMLWLEGGLVAFELETDRYLSTVEMGMGVEIESYSRAGLEGGFAGIVAGWRERPSKKRVTMVLIGSCLSVPGFELRDDGAVELREDGTPEMRE